MFQLPFPIQGRYIYSRLKKSKRKIQFKQVYYTANHCVALYLAPGRDLFFLPPEIVLMFGSVCKTHRWDSFFKARRGWRILGLEKPTAVVFSWKLFSGTR